MRIGWMKSRKLEQRAWRTVPRRAFCGGPIARDAAADRRPTGGEGCPARPRRTERWQIAPRGEARRPNCGRIGPTQQVGCRLAGGRTCSISSARSMPCPICCRVSAMSTTRSSCRPLSGSLVRGLSSLGAHGKERLEEWVDERTEVVLQRLDETATGGVEKTVAAVAIGLWGTTTAAAVHCPLPRRLAAIRSSG